MNICIPVYDDVDLLDVTGPFEMFTWGGLTVELVAAGPGPIRSRNSFYFFVDKSFSEASPCDVLWVPGGAPQGTQAAQEAQRNTQYYPCPPVSSTMPDTPPACFVPKVTIPPPKGAA
jgi:cyclohexyl-isocyanide hydratase